MRYLTVILYRRRWNKRLHRLADEWQEANQVKGNLAEQEVAIENAQSRLFAHLAQVEPPVPVHTTSTHSYPFFGRITGRPA